MSPTFRTITLLFVASSSIGAAPHGACPGHTPQPEYSAAWADAYLRWTFGERDLPLDEHGNAVLGHTVFLPIPETPGDGTPGSVTATLDRRESFTVPLWGLLGTSYSDGTPPDPLEPLSIFETLDITLSLDGVPLITGDNVLEFFAQLTLEPPIAVDAPPVSAAVWYETVGIVHPPLAPGSHTLQLDAVNTEPAFGSFFEYHNTWALTVATED